MVAFLGPQGLLNSDVPSLCPANRGHSTSHPAREATDLALRHQAQAAGEMSPPAAQAEGPTHPLPSARTVAAAHRASSRTFTTFPSPISRSPTAQSQAKSSLCRDTARPCRLPIWMTTGAWTGATRWCRRRRGESLTLRRGEPGRDTESSRPCLASRGSSKNVASARRLGGAGTVRHLGGAITARRLAGEDTARRLVGEDTARRLVAVDTARRLAGEDTARRLVAVATVAVVGAGTRHNLVGAEALPSHRGSGDPTTARRCIMRRGPTCWPCSSSDSYAVARLCSPHYC